jgi:hypothetical protein
MLVLNKQIVLSVDTPLDRPEMRRVSFYTETGNIFYLELAIDRTEFIRLHDFDSSEITDPDACSTATRRPAGRRPGRRGPFDPTPTNC